MAEDRVEGEMIEIGDPNIEPTAGEPPPRLVIEYRDRGVPWMLIPPMVVLGVVAGVVGYAKLAPPPPRPSPVAAPAPADPKPVAVAPSPSPTPAAPVAVTPEPESGLSPATPSPFDLVIDPPPVVSPTTPEAPAGSVLAQAPPGPGPMNRDQGIGFDPKGLVDPVPAVDQAVAPAAAPEGRRDPPAREAMPAREEARALPEEINPDVLPVDPREAVRRRQQRTAEARLKAEADRGQFHAELRAICDKFKTRSSPEIAELCKKYGLDVDPGIKAQAARLLSGPAAGADRTVRINLLRNLGFSEPVILYDLFDNLGQHVSKATRGGPSSKEEMLYHSAMHLLRYPPTRVASPTRPVSSNRPAR